MSGTDRPAGLGDAIIPSEAVYQALLAGGYDLSGEALQEVRSLLERARKATGVVRVPIRDAFASLPRGKDAPGEGRSKSRKIPQRVI